LVWFFMVLTSSMIYLLYKMIVRTIVNLLYQLNFKKNIELCSFFFDFVRDFFCNSRKPIRQNVFCCGKLVTMLDFIHAQRISCKERKNIS